MRHPSAGSPRPLLADSGRDARERLALLGFAIAAGLFTLFLALQRAVNDDDVCTLHAIWMFAHGHVPYREFFYYRPPSALILLSPLAWLAQTPSALFLGGRVIVAVAAAASLYWAGRIVRTRPHWMFLVALFWLLFLRGTAFYIFRVEYLTAALFVLHLFLLGGATNDTPRPARSFAAAMVLGLAATMSIRPLALLPVQPLWILSRRRGGRAGSETALWLAGLAAGVAPSLAYLGLHGLWAESFFWCFRFASFSEVTHWPPRLGIPDVLVPAVGFLALLLVQRDPSRGAALKTLLWSAFGAASIFHFLNPHRGSFTSVHLYSVIAVAMTMAAASLLARIDPVPTDKRRSLIGGFGALAVVLAAVGLVGLTAQNPVRFDRAHQRDQLRALDWLHEVAGKERVVLVAPHHTMVDPDATDLYDSFQFGYWIGIAPVQRRFAGFADSLIRIAPAVVSHDPWAELTNGKSLLEWLQLQGVLSEVDARRARRFLEENYERVEIPRLRASGYGSVFWIRKDRVAVAKAPP